MNTDPDFNNKAFINSLRVQESDFIDSGIASIDRREFKVGICDDSYNGQKVMQLHLQKHIPHSLLGYTYQTHEFEGDVPN